MLCGLVGGSGWNRVVGRGRWWMEWEKMGCWMRRAGCRVGGMSVSSQIDKLREKKKGGNVEEWSVDW